MVGIMGISRNNRIDDPIDFYQVVFGLNPDEVKRGLEKKFITHACEEKRTEQASIRELAKLSGKTITWEHPNVDYLPENFHCYVVK